MSSYMEKPCSHCPFRKDVTPFLHPERAYEIALTSQNRYAEFHCHKTIDHDEETGEGISTCESKQCAGMLTMRSNELGSVSVPDDFDPSFDLVYESPEEMHDAYIEEWEA